MGVAFVAEATDGVFDTLLSSVPPDGHLEEVLLEVGNGLLTSEERWEGARGVHRRRGRGGVAGLVGRGTLEISRGGWSRCRAWLVCVGGGWEPEVPWCGAKLEAPSPASKDEGDACQVA